MVQYSKLTLTAKGAAMNAKMIAGQTGFTFSKVCASDTVYTEAQLPNLTTLSGIKQTSLISKVTRSNNVTITIETAFTNASLTTGYYMRTLGLYAVDPNEGEILYAVCIAANDNCYMPPNNGVTSTGAYIKLIQTVGNASSVSLNVDAGAVATIGDIEALEQEIADLKGFVGYTDEDIYGVEVDFVNRRFTRLAGAKNRTAGSGFDGINAFGGRKRCNVTNAGKVVAYYGDSAYTNSGKLAQSVEVDGTTYAAGTIVQTLVEQPKYYYKVVPLVLEKVAKGWIIRKVRYYVSDTPKYGFKLHPLFERDGKIKEKVYLSAFEGSLWDASASDYILDDAQVADFANDMLCSIAGAKPISGLSQNLTRANVRKLAQKRGAGFEQQTIQAASSTQMLMLIEFATFNMQSALSAGNSTKADDGVTNMAEVTGATANLGNASGEVTNGNGIKMFSYRGEENFYANIWKWLDGLNKLDQDVYIADHSFADDTKTGYTDAGITACSANGYIKAFCYSEDFDWLFVPGEVGGDSALPVGDYYWYAAEWRVAILGGDWSAGAYDGAFCLGLINGSSHRTRAIGGRLLYIPDVDLEEEAAEAA